jgi:uncharacterized protein
LVANLYFYRDNQGHEIDLMLKHGAELTGIEIKSASTWHSSFKHGLEYFHQHIHPLATRAVVYSGDTVAWSDGSQSLNYRETQRLLSEAV